MVVSVNEKLPSWPMVNGGFVTAFSMRSIPMTINVAVTAWATLIVTTQLPVPLHPAPLQPVNADPLAGVAVNVTDVPLTNAALHVAPQLMPAGLLVTVPLPLPADVTLRVYSGVKLALTACAALIVTMQVPVPLHPAPLQPANTDPLAGAAVKVTCVPLTNAALHVTPQSMPAGLLLTVPMPLPVLVTVRVSPCVKVALTACAALMVTTQVPMPLHPPPLHPENTEPLVGVAVKVTCMPLANAALHVTPQSMPAGLLVTV